MHWQKCVLLIWLLYCGRWANATRSCGLFWTHSSGIDLQEKMDDIFRNGWNLWIVFTCDIHFNTGEQFFLYWSYKYSKNVIWGIYFSFVDTKYLMICAWCINSSHRLLLDAFFTTRMVVSLLDFSGVIQNLTADWECEKENTITIIGTMVLAGIWASLPRDLCGEFSFLRLFMILAAARTIS